MDDNNQAKEVMVSVICLTYNHESYIRQCLDGFVMQKTDFAFEAIVHDDASTDHTAEIIREYEEKYPNIIKPIYQDENQFSKNSPFLETYVLPKLKGKYIALCEGDDYWTDPLKLQKQVDYMEEHEDCVMCVNATDWERDGKIYHWGGQQYHSDDCDLTTEDVISQWTYNTASFIFRRELLDLREQCDWWKHADVVDFPLCIAGSLFGHLHYFSDVMNVYRNAHLGSWTVTIGHRNKEHELAEIRWMSELNDYTHDRYKTTIYTHLFKEHIRPLYRDGIISSKEYIRAYRASKRTISFRRFLKDIIRYYLKLVSVKLNN